MSWGEDRRWTKIGTAPASTTMRVWLEVPEAMLVSAQAASNCKQKFESFQSDHRTTSKSNFDEFDADSKTSKIV